MNKDKFTIVDEQRSPWLTIILLAWPILIEQILTSLVQAVDTAMVGSMGAIACCDIGFVYLASDSKKDLETCAFCSDRRAFVKDFI